MSNIVCTWCGRHDDSVKVVGASNIQEAREHALLFADCSEGITLDNGRHNTWMYDEPQPVDWVDSYVFNTVDEYVPDTREWWEK